MRRHSHMQVVQHMQTVTDVHQPVHLPFVYLPGSCDLYRCHNLQSAHHLR